MNGIGASPAQHHSSLGEHACPCDQPSTCSDAPIIPRRSSAVAVYPPLSHMRRRLGSFFDGSRTPNLLICPDCRHLYWERIPSAEELDQFYRQDYSDSHGQVEIQQSHRDYYRSHVEELVNLTGRARAEICLIDYGSSIPVLVHEAKDWGLGRPIAVDLDNLAFAYARKNNLEILTPARAPRSGSRGLGRYHPILTRPGALD